MGSVAGDREKTLAELDAIDPNRVHGINSKGEACWRYPATYQPAEHARALDALAVAVENVAASELGGGA
jgi:hypothetical protein